MARTTLRGADKTLSSLRRLDAGYERRLRAATMGRAILHNPEVQKVVDDMMALPKGSDARLAAAKKARDTPAIDRLSAEINRTLGNFNAMGDLEKGAIRRVMPFYAWYKAITKVAIGLPMDNPLRANILWNLGRIGKEQMAVYGNPNVPGSSIYGGLKLPGGRVLRTAQLNPFSTLPDVTKSIGAYGQGYLANIPGSGITQPSAAQLGFASGIFNPLLAAPLTGGLYHTGRYLPEARIAFPPPSSTYLDPGYQAEWLAYLGIPIRRPAGLAGGGGSGAALTQGR